MQSPAPAPIDSKHTPEPAGFEEHGARRQVTGGARHVITTVALAFSAYQLVIAAFAPISSQVTRSVHVGFLFAMAFLLHPAVQRKSQLHKLPWYDALLALAGFALGFYHWIFEADLIQRSGEPTTTDLVIGTIVV